MHAEQTTVVCAMTPRQRLDAIQQKLVARGVTDIKFCWSIHPDKPLSQACGEVADALECYLEGRFRPLAPFGDSQREL
jgi:hypothetical protein